MVRVLASSAVDCEFEPQSGQTKTKKNWYLFLLRKTCSIKEKDWLTRNQNNVSEWGDMSTRGLLFH